MTERKMYFDSILVNLNTVNFEKITNQIDKAEKYKIITNDSYYVTNVSNEEFDVYYERRVFLEPKEMFEITVGFDLKFILAPKTKKLYTENISELKTLIDEKIEKAIQLTNVVSRASSLISSISVHLNCNPIITPPTLQKR